MATGRKTSYLLQNSRAAIIYTGSASVLSWLVGRPLIALNSERYSREAELRFSMMRVNEHVDAISLAGGEADEKRRLGVISLQCSAP